MNYYILNNILLLKQQINIDLKYLQSRLLLF